MYVIHPFFIFDTVIMLYLVSLTSPGWTASLSAAIHNQKSLYLKKKIRVKHTRYNKLKVYHHLLAVTSIMVIT